MADYLDEEAEEDVEEDEEAMEDDGDDDDFQSPRKKKAAKKKKKRVAQVDDDDEDEDDEEVDDVVREQLADFIQDDIIEEEVVDEEDRKRKRSDDEDVELEEDDYELIEENIGVKVKRGPKFSRVRVESDDESDGEKKVKGKEDVQEELFGGIDSDDDREAPAKSAAKRPQNDRNSRLHAQDDDIGMDEEENSDEDSFIVDDDGKPIHSHKSRGARRYDDAALQEAQDIFGLDFDVEDLEEAEEDFDEEYEEEDEEGEVIRHTRRKKSRKSVMDVYEPSDLEHNLKTQADNAIRLADIPERFQLRSIPVETPAPEKAPIELLDEARWIHKQLFEDTMLSNQKKAKKTLTVLSGASAKPDPVSEGGWAPVVAPKMEPAEVEARVLKIKEVLDFIRVQCLEDRFISTYRKEYFEPDFNSEDIFEIYERDLLWMQLQRRRVNLVKLMVKMQEYLQRWRLDNPLVFEEGDELSDDTIDQVRNASTLVELADLFSEFKMIYGRHLPELHKSEGKKPAATPRRTKEPVFDENGVQIEQDNDAADGEDPDATVPPIVPDTPAVKRANRTDPYFLYKQAGLDKFIKKFGITAEKLAENVEGMFGINEIEQEPLDPEAVAETFISTRCPTASEVLKGAVSMMAWLIARNAHFRRVARQFFVQNAVLNVHATARGLKEIDESHSCYSFKWLANKPIKDLIDDQYLKIVQAKKDGQLESKILLSLDATSGKDLFLTKVIPLLSVDEYSKEVNAWNALRGKALEKAMTDILYVAFEKEVHEQLLGEAKSYVKSEIRRKLFDAIDIAPYVVNLLKRSKDEDWAEGDWDLSDGIRVMGIAFEENRDSAGYAVVVDAYGELLDSVKLPTIMKGQRDMRVPPEDIDRIVELFREKRPHVVAIASENRKAIDIKEALKPRLMFGDETHGDIPVEICDNLLSILYQNSETGRIEFPTQPPILRQAISIARRLLDPLLAFSQLYNIDDDILNLNFHPLQSQLSKEEFRNALQVEFVRRVNEVGVDLNQCVSHPLTHGSVVQFICGLGPRKAQHVMKLVKQNGVLVIRNQLVTVCRLGPKVFINCAGFIKINTDELSEAVTGDQYVEALDATRIHPEAYEWARKMAVDALDFDESNPTDALVEIFEHPEKLQELDLDAFGGELERLDFGNKRITLAEIKQELMESERFGEIRLPYKSPTEEQIFDMIVGEPLSEFRIGRLVSVTVTGFGHSSRPPVDYVTGNDTQKVSGCDDWLCKRCRTRGFVKPDHVYDHLDNGDCPGFIMSVRVVMDNAVWGYIPLTFLSDRQPIELPQERVKKGMVVHARIIKAVDASRFYTEFTSKSSDLVDKENRFKQKKDEHYDEDAESEALNRELKKRTKLAPKTNFLKRVIAHPAFKNVNFEEAEKILGAPDVLPGEAIIRPSSKSNNKLTLSWKVASGIHDHVEISERDKENAFSLGRKLIIDDEEYDDLDEILARYVQPMANFVNDLVQHKYHVDSHGGLPGVQRDVQRVVIDRWLRDQKLAITNRIPFCFSECVCAPRRFFLCHLPRENVREEFLTVSPRGYSYRRLTFDRLEKLVKYFKENFHFPPPVPLGTTPHASVTMSGTGGMSTGTPRLAAGTNLAALTQAVKILPAHVWERLQEAGGSTGRTPNVFATPRTPSGSMYNPAGARGAASSGGTPSGATPSTASGTGWGRAAQQWQQAMMGQPQPAQGTPSATLTGTTNWAAAAAAWVTSSSTAPSGEPPAT